MKILYLKGCKWLLSQNQRVRYEFSGYGQSEALAKYIRPFFTKHRSERTSVPQLLDESCNDHMQSNFLSTQPGVY